MSIITWRYKTWGMNVVNDGCIFTGITFGKVHRKPRTETTNNEKYTPTNVLRFNINLLFKSFYLFCIGCQWCLSFSFHMDMNMNLFSFFFCRFESFICFFLWFFFFCAFWIAFGCYILSSSDCTVPAIRYKRSIVSSPWHTIWLNNLVSNVIIIYYIVGLLCVNSAKCVLFGDDGQYYPLFFFVFLFSHRPLSHSHVYIYVYVLIWLFWAH